MTPRAIDPVRAEAIRTLYVQARNSALAAAVVTIYMAATAWTYSRHDVIAGWVAAQVIAQMLRIALVRVFERRHPPDAALSRWAFAYTAYMACAGLLWGAAPFLFIHPAQPITIALTLCGLYGIAGGSVPGNAYNSPGLFAFVGGIFGLLAVRLILLGSSGLVTLALASLAYAGILAAFCRVQARSIEQSIRIRFENAELVAALRARTREAEQASLTKSQFLAAASHDLRQPLHALGLLVSTLEPLGLSSATGRIIRDIKSNLAAMEGLFNGLLDIARLDAGAVEAHLEPIVVDELFDRLDHLLRPTATELGLDLRFRSDGTAMFSDPVLIEQILLNLVTNALRNTRVGGVMVAARKRGGRVRLEVWDTGIGIAAADRARIFEEFVQVGNPERNRRMGMGLGLSITRRAAQLLDTAIALSSVPGKGSVFWLDQAIAPGGQGAMAGRRPLPAPGEPSRAPSPRERPAVLFVDDDSAVRDALDVFFRHNGIAARICPGVQAGLLALDEDDYAAIFCDYRLPGDIDGLSFLDLARSGAHTGRPHTGRLFLVTGDMDKDILARAHRLNLEILHKPLSGAVILAKLDGR